MTHKPLIVCLLLAASLATACAPETPEGDGDGASAALAGHAGAGTGKSGSAGSGAAGKASTGGAAGLGGLGSSAGAAGTSGGSGGAAGSAAGGLGGLGGSPAGGAGSAGGAAGKGDAGSSAAAGAGGAAGAKAGAGGAGAGAAGTGAGGSAVGTAMPVGTPIKLTIVASNLGNIPDCPPNPAPQVDLMLSMTILGKTYMGTGTCYNNTMCGELDTGLSISGIQLGAIQTPTGSVSYTIWDDRRAQGGGIVKCNSWAFSIQNPLIISADNEYDVWSAPFRVRIEKM